MLDDSVTKRAEIARIIAGQLLGGIRSVSHQPFGHSGITFELVTDSGSYILKTSTKESAFKHTAHNISMLRGLGIPVADILSTGTKGSVHFVLSKKIPGRDLGFILHEMTRPQISRLASQIVDIQKRVASLPNGQQFGWTPIGVQGPFKSWTEIVKRDAMVGDVKLQEQISGMTRYLDSVEPICFLDDITMKNVIVENGELQGIVDLDFICYGDPMYMLGLTETTAVLDVGFDALFYGQELRRFWGISGDQRQATALYNAVHTSQFLSRTDLSEDARSRMTQWLAMNIEELDSAKSDPG